MYFINGEAAKRIFSPKTLGHVFEYVSIERLIFVRLLI